VSPVCFATSAIRSCFVVFTLFPPYKNLKLF
jgi:hypothetical protein